MGPEPALAQAPVKELESAKAPVQASARVAVAELVEDHTGRARASHRRASCARSIPITPKKRGGAVCREMSNWKLSYAPMAPSEMCEYSAGSEVVSINGRRMQCVSGDSLRQNGSVLQST
jgi:hypothetical protein